MHGHLNQKLTNGKVKDKAFATVFKHEVKMIGKDIRDIGVESESEAESDNDSES